MDKRKLVERVASGLRRCKTPPDYLIWIDNKDYICYGFVLYLSTN